jgi:hypothetical protein
MISEFIISLFPDFIEYNEKPSWGLPIASSNPAALDK